MATALEFQALAEADFDAILAGEVAESLSYTSFGEEPVTVQAVIERRMAQIQTFLDGTGIPMAADVHIKVASLPVTPTYQDLLVFDGMNWGVREITQDPDTGVWRLFVMAYESHEKGRVNRYVR